MPIKFRCVYCEQLLGIARRKAGTVVKCPNCAGQLIVPAPEPGAVDDDDDKDDATAAAPELELAASRKSGGSSSKPSPKIDAGATEGGMLFERSDFDELLKPVQEKRGPSLAPSPARGQPQWPVTLPDAYEAPPAPAPVISAPSKPVAAQSERKGFLLTPLRVALLLAFGILGSGAAFAGGLLAGHFLWK